MTTVKIPQRLVSHIECLDDMYGATVEDKVLYLLVNAVEGRLDEKFRKNMVSQEHTDCI